MVVRPAVFIFIFIMTASLGRIDVLCRSASEAADNGIAGLDLSAGRIGGGSCEYEMKIPGDWSEYFIIERENLAPGTRILEKLNFYWQPKNHPLIFLASVYIFENRYSADAGSYKKILETDEFDFRIYVSATEPELENAGDRILHNHFIEQMNDISFFSDLFIFPEGKGPVIKDRLFVNGRDIGGSIIFDLNNPFLPLRAVCEALSYEVVWNGTDASVFISKEGFEYTLYTAGPRNFDATRVENSFYVPAIFFVQALKTNFEIDKRGNVYITE